MKYNARRKNARSCCPKEMNQCPCVFPICFKPNYMFCSSFEPFILVGLQQTMGWGYHLLCLFSLVMLYCTVVVSSSSVILVWSYKVVFSEK